MVKLAILFFGLTLVAGKSFAGGEAGIAYYYGNVRYYAPDGQTPRGQTVSLVKRTVNPSASQIIEIVTQPDRQSPKRATDFKVILSRVGTSNEFSVSGDTFRGVMAFTGADWNWNAWSYDIELTTGGFLRGSGTISCSGIDTNKEIQDQAHNTVLRMVEELRPISASEYERMKKALHSGESVSRMDCSAAYGGKAAICERVSCDEKYLSFIGKWAGPFEAYVQELSSNTHSVFRPFSNIVTYSEDDCLRNVADGDTFIIGRRTDNYPAFGGLPEKTSCGLLVTGKHQDGSPFLLTVDDENGPNKYQLEYKNALANLSIWSLTVPAKGKSPEMRFLTIDGQDFKETATHKRDVTVTMSIGPADKPFWEGIVTKGYHSLTPPNRAP